LSLFLGWQLLFSGSGEDEKYFFRFWSKNKEVKQCVFPVEIFSKKVFN